MLIDIDPCPTSDRTWNKAQLMAVGMKNGGKDEDEDDGQHGAHSRANLPRRANAGACFLSRCFAYGWKLETFLGGIMAT